MHVQGIRKESPSLLAFRGAFIWFFKNVQEQNVLKQNMSVNIICVLSIFQQPHKCPALQNHVAKQLYLAVESFFFSDLSKAAK